MRMAGSAMQSLFADMGSPDFTGMSRIGQESLAEQKMQAQKSQADVDYSKMAGDAKMAKAEMQADVIGAQSAAQGQAQMGSMIGQAGGALGGLFGGGGGVAPSTTSFGSGASAPIISDTTKYASAFSNPSFNLFGGR